MLHLPLLFHNYAMRTKIEANIMDIALTKKNNMDMLQNLIVKVGPSVSVQKYKILPFT